MIGRAALAALALAAGIGTAVAQATDPVEISADSLVIVESSKEATFEGNVVALRTGLKVTANKVVVIYGNGIEDIQKFDAIGNVRIETEGQSATGERAEFDPVNQILRLTGNVSVQNSAGSMSGAELVVDLRTNDTVFTAGQGQRVTGTFTPQ
jgi:lipopolysaccharide export system protein LptA